MPYKDRQDLRDKQAEYRRRNVENSIKYLREHPCVDCGEDDIVVLDYDHRDPSEKKFSIGHRLRGTTSWNKIYEEILKCDVRCANCHRKKTAREENWYKCS